MSDEGGGPGTPEPRDGSIVRGWSGFSGSASKARRSASIPASPATGSASRSPTVMAEPSTGSRSRIQRESVEVSPTSASTRPCSRERRSYPCPTTVPSTGSRFGSGRRSPLDMIRIFSIISSHRASRARDSDRVAKRPHEKREPLRPFRSARRSGPLLSGSPSKSPTRIAPLVLIHCERRGRV